MSKTALARWRGNFLTGLAVLLPAVISIGLLKWLFGTIAGFTDLLLFWLPPQWTHEDAGKGRMFWYWSVAAFVVAVVLVALAGLLTRYYIGKKLVTWLDGVMRHVPLLNKIYGAIKQVNDAFTANSKNAFKTVVRVEFPSKGMYSIGFITGEPHGEIHRHTKDKIVSVFIPTTPIPTTGYLILVPEDKITKLDMSVADGLKYIVSLGAISPEQAPPAKRGWKLADEN